MQAKGGGAGLQWVFGRWVSGRTFREAWSANPGFRFPNAATAPLLLLSHNFACLWVWDRYPILQAARSTTFRRLSHPPLVDGATHLVSEGVCHAQTVRFAPETPWIVDGSRATPTDAAAHHPSAGGARGPLVSGWVLGVGRPRSRGWRISSLVQPKWRRMEA
jgi:hypothetical protein